MKAVVWHGVGDIRLDDVPEPQIEQPTDAIVRLTASAICGTDLHFIRGTGGEMVPGTILGHEGVGIVEQVGADVRNFRPGDRVVIPSTIGCGYCSYCRAGYYSQCDNANPNGPLAGTCFYGGPKTTGPIQGLQAEKARILFAATNLVKIPDGVTDQQAIMVSDIFPTGYFGADIADIKPGHTVAVFGCGPVGQFVIASAKLMKAGRIFAVDRIPSRLDTARAQGAEAINFEQEDPVEALRRLTGGIGVDRAIDAVGVDAKHADHGPAAQKAQQEEQTFQQELEEVAPQGTAWNAGDAPSQALEWAVQGLCKAGTLSIIGVYPQTMQNFPVGAAMNKNLTIRSGNCNHRKYIPMLLDLVEQGTIDPEKLLSQVEEMSDAIGAYHAFDERQPGWLKVELVPGM
ncbi:glutathione-dependent formaldehyde dehydrogenase (plasmid) [Deinococcus metallilatus]|uniref:Glutathione-dependent formaldehyde dehydrogenase n=2 Tax=Deinococcus metallilatus TaxID=1211322 RepID=A0AAJ5K044_9DEIO|nr:zinc-dependent alcohol dehydrogenase [Deinococcus metallilatus]MBB5297379.1 threonine dehydrogenase-like Zn-dependent dehydrogenase [Deinococcus metallilatus]QBY06944.1 glutathione-dependent formaldehyde dehydrogenase [Deinococcus metallilatus]TLK32334.1 glutathione-dependent formaldehyde dehydrogenase [Deinococcus metallilatus]GMA17084.1 glutathione-dependent formaldehyde dehydrogenase [Deinococcus metallilatus]